MVDTNMDKEVTDEQKEDIVIPLNDYGRSRFEIPDLVKQFVQNGPYQHTADDGNDTKPEYKIRTPISKGKSH